MKIGFFDSGLGGLLVLDAVEKVLPKYSYLYYGDTKNLPLGDKNEPEIYECTKAGVKYLFVHDCILVIVACNTASAETLRKLQDTFIYKEFPERRVLGVIIPTIEAVIECGCKDVLLLGTERTINSGKYKKEFDKHTIRSPRLVSVATPHLVPLIEAKKIKEALSVAKSTIKSTCKRVGEVGCLILGCTHYILLKEALREEYGDKLKIFSQDEIIPEKLKLYLNNHPEIEERLIRSKGREVFLTEQRLKKKLPE